MEYFFITVFVFLLVVAMLGIGHIVKRKELKGSCGGLGAIMGEDCMFCEKKESCEKEREEKSARA